MSEWKLFDGDAAHVSTFEFHEHRERATHLEQPAHRPRLMHAAGRVLTAIQIHEGHTGATPSMSDLGCGDGGLLSLLTREIEAWGYDFQPSNSAGWAERGVKAEALDVFGADRDRVRFGDITTVTEVLEHIADPHGAVRWIGEHSKFIVASSPWNETPEHHDECHAWAFDLDGYRGLIEQGGFRILTHEQVLQFQVILGWRP
jgi:hypothetical protein